MKSKPILYSLEPFDLAGHRFRVTLMIPKPNPRGQTVSLPAWIPGSYLIRDFARQIETISARSGNRRLTVVKVDNHSWQVEPCTGPLQITTTVYAWDLSVRGAHLDETHGFFNGTSVYLRPHGFEEHPCQVALIAPAGADWRVYTSLPQATQTKSSLKVARDYANGFGVYEARNYDDLIDHPVEMGRPQVVRFDACGAPHEMVFTGVIPNLDLKRISRDVKAICETQIGFFEPSTSQVPFLDTARKYVFMTMVTGDAYGGLEHRASTALMAARKDLPTLGQKKAPEGYQTFLGLVSHEYFHTWNVKRIKPAAFAPYDLTKETHTRLLWIFEGFTSYYDDLMLLRSGVLNESDYLQTLAKQISGVYATPGRHKQSVAESSFDAWSRYYKQDENSPNALVSYYTKGSLIALGLDLTIRSATNQAFSLDHVMRRLWEEYGRDFYQGVARGLKEKAFVRLVLDCTGVDVSEEIARWAYGREDVPLRSLFALHRIAMQWGTANNLPTLDVRTRKQGDHVVLTTVFEHGAAHQGGLSAHDILVAINGVRIDSANNSLESVLARHLPGKRVKVHVFRRDELREFSVKLAAPAQTQCQLKPMTSLL
jgi:predicted metalloprotease with PDZ domain